MQLPGVAGGKRDTRIERNAAAAYDLDGAEREIFGRAEGRTRGKTYVGRGERDISFKRPAKKRDYQELAAV